MNFRKSEHPVNFTLEAISQSGEIPYCTT